MPDSAPPLPKVVLVGVAGGILSGLFGVGGGIVMVPLSALWLGPEQRRAIATSLIAIIPIALAGLARYATGSSVNWKAGLTPGLGGQMGVRLLPRVPVGLLQGILALILLYSAYRLVFPADDIGTGLEQFSGQLWLLLVVVGVVAGILAGLLGVGSGKANSDLMLADCGEAGIAAKVARDYAGGGKTDWFLPSLLELKALDASGKGDLTKGGFWSSSQATSEATHLRLCIATECVQLVRPKSEDFHVRPIRPF